MKILIKKEDDILFRKKPKQSNIGSLPDINDFSDSGLSELQDLDRELERLGSDFMDTKNLGFEKPKEVIEAQQEINSAIESVKNTAKPSFFKRFFAPRKKAIPANNSDLIVHEGQRMAMLQRYIDMARQALLRYDLEQAKLNYTNAMKIYKKLKPEEQSKAYQELHDLYSERKSAEELVRS